MNSPDEYDWGLTPEAIDAVREGFSISVEISLTPQMVETVAMLSGTPVADISQHLDTHIKRGTE